MPELINATKEYNEVVSETILIVDVQLACNGMLNMGLEIFN